jgi:hypothetical protein
MDNPETPALDIPFIIREFTVSVNLSFCKIIRGGSNRTPALQ